MYEKHPILVELEELVTAKAKLVEMMKRVPGHLRDRAQQQVAQLMINVELGCPEEGQAHKPRLMTNLENIDAQIENVEDRIEQIRAQVARVQDGMAALSALIEE